MIAMSASIAVGGPLIEAAGPRAAYALTGVLGVLADGHHLVGRVGAAHAAARCPGGRRRGSRRAGRAGARAPGGVLEAAEDYARV